MDGLLKVATVNLDLKLANPIENCKSIVENSVNLNEKNVDLIVFHELSTTGVKIGDLFLFDEIYDNVKKGIEYILNKTKNLSSLIVFGSIYKYNNNLYNSIFFVNRGKIQGIIPKRNLNLYDKRYFSESKNLNIILNDFNQEFFFGNDLKFVTNDKQIVITGEISEDLYLENSMYKNTSVVVNIGYTPRIYGNKKIYENIILSKSLINNVCYIYNSGNYMESTTDEIGSGYTFISNDNKIYVKENEFEDNIFIKTIDVSNNKFTSSNYTKYVDCIRNQKYENLVRNPYIVEKENICDIIDIAVYGLCRRLKHINVKDVVLGLSGGLDSTIALVIVNKAFEKLNLSKKGIHLISMPCFGTSKKTKSNIEKLVKAFKLDVLEIDISESVNKHLSDIFHDKKLDIAFENAQARERTQVLMDIANMKNAIVIGTGDLSEIALGFSTYNGDHMSMYNVNATIPKTLMRTIIDEINVSNEIKEALLEVKNTNISPELLPSKDGEIVQKTEEILGSYEVNDFIMYYMIGYKYKPSKIFNMLKSVFVEYNDKELKNILYNFYKRFFSSQYKRTSAPDGAGTIFFGLSQRNSFFMPSDIDSKIWLDEIEKM